MSTLVFYKGIVRKDETHNNGDRYQQKFDAYCKTVLRNATKNYIRELNRRRKKERSFDLLSAAEQEQLTIIDHYPSDSFTFSAYGYVLLIENEEVAEAFTFLSRMKQTVLILRFAAGYNDRESGALIGLARSTIQYHKSTALKELKRKLMLPPEGG